MEKRKKGKKGGGFSSAAISHPYSGPCHNFNLSGISDSSIGQKRINWI